MNVKETKRQIQLQEWVTQVRTCKQSGLPVRQWCKENGVAVKSYYYHLKRVREELLDVMQTRYTTQIQNPDGFNSTSIPEQSEVAVRIGDCVPAKTEKPVFATLPMPQNRGAAVTVQMGGYAIDIQNGAEDIMVEHVLKVVSRL